MTPIISPWVIYGVKVLSNLQILFIIMAVMLIVSLPVAFDMDYKWVKRLFVLSFIFALLAILIPDRETILTMLVVQNITPDNIAIAQDNIVDFVAKIVKAVNQVK